MSSESSPKLPHAPGSEQPTLTGAEIFRILRKHLLLMLACWGAVVCTVTFWTLGQTRIYRAESLLRLDPDPPKPLGKHVDLVASPGSLGWNRREFYETEFRVMRSMRVAMAVVRQLGLHADPEFLQVPAKARGSFRPVSIEDAARVLVSRISVEPVRDSSLVYLRYEDADPQRCQHVLNSIVRIYLSQNLEVASSVSSSAAEWLNGQLEHLKDDLEKSEIALNAFRQKNNVLSVSLEDRHNMTTTQLETLSKEMTTLEIRRGELGARAAELASIKADDPMSIPATELLASHILTTLRTAYADQVRQLEDLSATMGAEHPKVVAARAKRDVTAKLIAKEVENVQGAINRDLRAVNRQLSDLKKKEEEIHKQAHELQSLALPYNQLSRTKVNNEKIYAMVLERARETDLTRVMNFNNVRVVDEALTPKAPVRPNVPTNLSMAAIVGLLLGAATAILRELSDRSIKTPADVETVLGVTCLGLIPDIMDRASLGRRVEAAPGRQLERDLIVAQRPDSGIAEAVRAIRTNLTFMSPDRPYRVLVVTSAMPEEGKTTVACSLALALAQGGSRVLLVDTDLRRPRIHRTFQESNDIGLTMAVSGQAPIEDCVRETEFPNLSLLTSGPVPPNPAELLQSERFAAIVGKVREKYDHVIFDSPPVLPVTDAVILSRLADGVVVVARGYRTQKAAARHALRQFFDVKSHVIGLVLNAIDLNAQDYRGRYYYYKRDGYYSASK